MRMPPFATFAAGLVAGVTVSFLSVVIAASPPARIPDSPEQAIFNLYQRVTVLEQQVHAQQAGKSRVKAPFEVVDSSGTPILRVVDGGAVSRGLYVLNKSGNVASQVAVLEESGGRIVAYPGGTAWGAATPSGLVGIAYFDTGPEVLLKKGGKEIARINEKYGFSFANSAGAGVARLGAGSAGGGYLSLGNPGGDAVVEGGMLPDGRGMVRVYPNKCAPNAAAMGLGLPDCIVGQQVK